MKYYTIATFDPYSGIVHKHLGTYTNLSEALTSSLEVFQAARLHAKYWPVRGVKPSDITNNIKTHLAELAADRDYLNHSMVWLGETSYILFEQSDPTDSTEILQVLLDNLNESYLND